MITLNGYTLFPHQADWSTRPSWKRKWQTGVGSGTTGLEQRSALRAQPLHSLTYTVTAASLPLRSRLDARVDQATKSGLAAVPFFGRGAVLEVPAAAGTNSLTLSDAVNPWPWQIGDYAVLLGADDTIYDVLAVQNVVGNVLTLAGNLGNTWLSEWVRPLLFGKFSSEKQTVISPWYTPVKITVTELTSSRSAQIGITPAQAPGVGAQVIGRTNKL